MPVCAECSCKKQSVPQYQEQEGEQEQHQEHQGRNVRDREATESVLLNSMHDKNIHMLIRDANNDSYYYQLICLVS